MMVNRRRKFDPTEFLPWTVEGAAGQYEFRIREATKKIAREPQSSVVERANNARDIASSGRALALQYFVSRDIYKK